MPGNPYLQKPPSASTPVACGGATAVDGFSGIKQVALETLPRALAHHRTDSPCLCVPASASIIP
ncbi:hypothetical protein [Chlorogloeopsis sp. ULAP02]|uniref:hypothetical protein n=1 Tax=Chlorogloeopsis sp. ULAP02 TaxID=3107926 RepID=UPI00398B5AA7